MRFRHVLDDILGRRSNVVLLRFLVRTRGEHSGRDLARLVGLDHKTCHAALRGLTAQGVVDSRRLGTALAYRLRDRHPVVQDILKPAFAREEDLAERFVRDAAKLARTRALSVVLFGSVVRGEEGPESDVDILFVVKDPASRSRAKGALDEVAGELAARYGSVPQFIVEDLASFRCKIGRGDPFLNEVLRSGRVVLGKSLSEILSHGSQKDRHAKRPPK
jgi:predicted nucleotidyltransferase